MRVGTEKPLRTGFNIGEVTASAARDNNLAAGFSAVINQQDFFTTLPGDGGTHQASAAGTKDDGIVIIRQFLHPI